MTAYKQNFSRVRNWLFVLSLSLVMSLAHVGSSGARPPAPGPHPVVKPPAVRYPYRPGPSPRPYKKVYPALPLGFLTLAIAGTLFYYSAGNYYRRAPQGYVLVQAPPGAVIKVLPQGHQAVVINGVTYYTYGGAYYQYVGNGYKVVPAPVQGPVSPQETPAQSTVVVSAHALNVRTGPGMEHAVTYIVNKGDRLQVIGTAQEWYYVELPDGSEGWVNSRYTAPLFSAPEG